MICSYLIFPFPIVIIHIFLFGKKSWSFFCRRFVCKSAGTQLFYENTASALIATSLLLLQATERRHRKTTPLPVGSVKNSSSDGSVSEWGHRFGGGVNGSDSRVPGALTYLG